jgi:5'-phosphate synthase pdxT subunit
VFIRAPVIERVGGDVEILATCDDVPVLVRQGHLVASSFHPEITGDARLHGMFVEIVRDGI